MANGGVDLSAFAEWLKNEQKRRNMSVREFAEFCGELSHGTIFRYTSGVCWTPSVARLEGE